MMGPTSSAVVAADGARDLEIRGVTRRFGDVTALDSVTVRVAKGEIVGVLGPNGAGKSTLLRLCEGLEAPDAGRVLAFGKDLRVDTAALKSRLGLVLQRPRFSTFATVREVVELFSSLKAPRIPADDLMDQLSLEAIGDMRVGQLSGGQRQRLAVLIAVMWSGDLVLLDEPTSELDPQGRRIVWDLIRRTAREHDSAVLMSTHQMEEAEVLCDRIYIVDHGRVIASGTPSEVIGHHCEHVSVRFTVDAAALDCARRKIGDFEAVRHGQVFKCRQRVLSIEEGRERVKSLVNQKLFDLMEVRLARSDLEDVFIALTGAQLRA